MTEKVFELKFTSKQLSRLHAKAAKEEEKELLKVKKAMEKGDGETARIYAQNAIRQKATGNGYLRLASRLDAVASRVESAVKMKQVTKQMGAVTKGMDRALKSMDVAQIAKVMDQFEASFDEVDVRSAAVEATLASSTASAMPEDQVDSLLQQVSDAHGLEFRMNAASASTAPVQVEQEAAALVESGEDALEKRLAALRG